MVLIKILSLEAEGGNAGGPKLREIDEEIVHYE
jgi:hypothetical protein